MWEEGTFVVSLGSTVCGCPGWEEHLGGTSFNGTRSSQGPARTQETSTDSPTACTSCQSAQWRLILAETTNTLALLRRGFCLGVMFDLHIHNCTHNKTLVPILFQSPLSQMKESQPYVSSLRSHSCGGTLCLSMNGKLPWNQWRNCIKLKCHTDWRLVCYG